MSEKKNDTTQFTQANPAQADSLDAQYKPIGISAVSAAAALKYKAPKKTDDQMA